MSAKSILSSGNTSFLNELYSGTGSLSLESLSIGDITGAVILTNPDPGVLQVSGALAPSDIQDNSGSIGTTGQVLAKALTGTDMLWTTISSGITAGAVPTVATLLTIPEGEDSINTILTNDIQNGVDNTDPDAPITYLVGTYLFTYNLQTFTPSADTITASELQISANALTGPEPIGVNTGTVGGSGVGYSLVGTQLITFTTAMYGSIQFIATFAGDAGNTITINASEFVYSYIKIGI